MSDMRTENGELKKNVAAMIEEYMSLGVRLAPQQIFLQLVARGLLEDTPEDFENLQQAMPSVNDGGSAAALERERRLHALQDIIREAHARFEAGEPNLLEDIEAILHHAFAATPQANA
jgi:hypothetical protein